MATLWTFTSLLIIHFSLAPEPIENIIMYSSVITGIHQKLYFGCISIIQTHDDLWDKLWFAKLEKKLLQENIFMTFTQNFTSETTKSCKKNIPLNVIFFEGSIPIKQVLKVKHKRWLLFLADSQNLGNIFDGVNIPFDTEVIVAQRSINLVNITEVFHVHNSLPLQLQHLGNWSYDNGLQWTTKSTFERRKNLQGLVFRTSFATACPTTLPKYVNNTIVTVEGYFGEVWSTLQSALNFSSQYVQKCYWGILLPNNTWTDMIGSVVHNETEVGISATTMTSCRTHVVDFLTPILDGRVVLFLQKSELDLTTYGSSFSKPFSWTFWIAVVTSLFLFALSLWFTCTLAKLYGYQKSPEYTLLDALHTVLGSYCGQGQERTPQNWSCRIVFVMSYVVGVVLLSAYSASLISFLSVQNSKPLFHTLEEMLSKSSYTLVMPAGGELYFLKESPESAVRRFYQKQFESQELLLPTYEEVHKRICNDSKFVAIMSSYVMTGLSALKKLPCNLTSVPQVSFPEVLGIILRKESPYMRILDHYLLKMKSTGIIKRIKDQHIPKTPEEPEEHTFEVTMEAAFTIFIVLLSGYAASLLFLALEIIIHKLNKRKFSNIVKYEDVNISE